MKRILLCSMLILSIFTFCFAQDDIDAGMDYTKAIMQKGAEAKITAFKAYLKKYPNKTKKFTQLAIYQLAINYFEAKQYQNAIQYANEALQLLGTEKGPKSIQEDDRRGETVRLFLVLANSYGIKGGATYKQPEALKYAKKAEKLARAIKDQSAIQTAQKIISKVSGPPPKKVTPEQKFKRFYQNGEYPEAISTYKTLPQSAKATPDIYKAYADALYKAKQYDSALKEFGLIYTSERTGMIALRLAKIYEAKGKRSKSHYDNAANYYLEAGFLFGKEKKYSNQKIANQNAKIMLQMKYNYKSVYNKAQKEVSGQKASAVKNQSAIRNKKKEIRGLQRKKREYQAQDIEPPGWLDGQIEKAQKELADLQSGKSGANTESQAYKELSALQDKINKELNAKTAAVKKKLEK